MPIPIFAIYLGLILASYLIGSFPTGYVLGRLRGIDIRHYGSGKTGGTNVQRTLGWGAMLIAASADAAKGLLAVVLTQQVTGSPLVVVLCGIAVVAGHNWPVYIQFKGGSGVGTGFGVLLGLAPVVGLLLSVVFVVPVVLTRYMSLGSITAAATLPFAMLVFARSGELPVEYALFGLAGSALILWRHRGNMKRLLDGTERKVGDRVEINNQR